jgi:hypothetical protein
MDESSANVMACVNAVAVRCGAVQCGAAVRAVECRCGAALRLHRAQHRIASHRIAADSICEYSSPLLLSIHSFTLNSLSIFFNSVPSPLNIAPNRHVVAKILAACDVWT